MVQSVWPVDMKETSQCLLLDEGRGDGPGQDHVIQRHPRNLVHPQLAAAPALGSASSGTPQFLRLPPSCSGSSHLSEPPEQMRCLHAHTGRSPSALASPRVLC